MQVSFFPSTVYVDKSGRLAAMDAVTFVNTESFAGDEGVKQVKIDFHAEVKGGAYRLQNFVTTIGLTANEDNVTIRADRVGTYDGKNLEDSLTFSVFEEGIIDLNGEIFIPCKAFCIHKGHCIHGC